MAGARPFRKAKHFLRARREPPESRGTLGPRVSRTSSRSHYHNRMCAAARIVLSDPAWKDVGYLMYCSCFQQSRRLGPITVTVPSRAGNTPETDARNRTTPALLLGHRLFRPSSSYSSAYMRVAPSCPTGPKMLHFTLSPRPESRQHAGKRATASRSCGQIPRIITGSPSTYM